MSDNVDDLYQQGIKNRAEERRQRYVEALLDDSDEAVANFHKADEVWKKLVKGREELNRGGVVISKISARCLFSQPQLLCSKN